LLKLGGTGLFPAQCLRGFGKRERSGIGASPIIVWCGLLARRSQASTTQIHFFFVAEWIDLAEVMSCQAQAPAAVEEDPSVQQVHRVCAHPSSARPSVCPGAVSRGHEEGSRKGPIAVGQSEKSMQPLRGASNGSGTDNVNGTENLPATASSKCRVTTAKSEHWCQEEQAETTIDTGAPPRLEAAAVRTLVCYFGAWASVSMSAGQSSFSVELHICLMQDQRHQRQQQQR